jgi:Fe-S oxidoreductase
MTENLRKFPESTEEPISPFFDYSKEGGLLTAIEICNGNGVCRKLDVGTMCPSYMVTREEEHSTRGRANALRAILTGKLTANEFTSQRMYEVMDLCLGCKGCKGECPTNVDMGKLKQEFLYHYQKANGLSLRERLFGNIEKLNRVGCAAAPVSNWLTRNVAAGWLLHATLGVDCRRTLPPFARQTFRSWFSRRPKQSKQRAEQRVVLFPDTFVNYNCRLRAELCFGIPR